MIGEASLLVVVLFLRLELEAHVAESFSGLLGGEESLEVGVS